MRQEKGGGVGKEGETRLAAGRIPPRLDRHIGIGLPGTHHRQVLLHEVGEALLYPPP